MKTAYFDCRSGASGDMILASLIDAGVEVSDLYEALKSLDLGEFAITTHETSRGGVRGILFEVSSPEEQSHRHLKDIQGMVDSSSLPDDVKQRSKRVFRTLAEAEALVHGTSPEEIHFHEVGAVDSIVDIVGAVTAFDMLGIDTVLFGTIALGSGTVECEHGVLPVPAPATVKMIEGLRVLYGDGEGELLTPTGAAILSTLGEQAPSGVDMTVEATGCGAGGRETASRPNILRVTIGSAAEPAGDDVLVMETNIDDMSGEGYPVVCEQLLAEGALDAYIAPVLMKKGRPGHVLTVLLRPEDRERMENIVFRNTTTFGVRFHTARRTCLERRELTVDTSWGPIRVKQAILSDEVLRSVPEYEDCRRAAESTGSSFREIYDAVTAQMSRDR